ncbi:MAG: hypothetical protein N3F66_14935 [Spirochaetes bacterium]|nr:hypothetical protein [Spirochaetota bacterium]
MKEINNRIVKYRNLPNLYIIIKLGSIIFLMISSVLLMSYFLIFLEKTYNLPKSLGWLLLPLLFLLFPIIMLLYNFLSYAIIPLRKYLEKIHKENNLPRYSESNKELLKGILCFLPSLGVVILVIILSIIGIPENIIGPITISLTLLTAISGIIILINIL